MKLDIGSQNARFQDFTTVDMYAPEADVRADALKLPFPDNSIEDIWASHILEHFKPSQVQPALKEWLRVLKPGARARIVIPDLDDACRAWLERRVGAMGMIFGGFGEEAGQTHFFGWGPLELRDELLIAGYNVLSVQTMKETATHNLGGTYWHNMVNIFAEVRKPT
jgi:predicted SAM-dependent methyltransferase